MRRSIAVTNARLYSGRSGYSRKSAEQQIGVFVAVDGRGHLGETRIFGQQPGVQEAEVRVVLVRGPERPCDVEGPFAFRGMFALSANRLQGERRLVAFLHVGRSGVAVRHAPGHGRRLVGAAQSPERFGEAVESCG